ncbi:hypothetical protein R5R35_004385 [Gryllus longicercus]|uniref:NR LBD domain-containing protein n=1 Tax=Gryllus longicercus TaxID=2509291 RepID=A0AAN9VIQ7_9ORTH|nr:Ecdysone-induced protein 78C [Gryllus bimaculatus]
MYEAVAAAVAQAYLAHCGYTEERTRCLMARKPIAAQPPPPPSVQQGSEPESPEAASSTAESLEQQKAWLWMQFAAHVTPSVQRVVEFAKRVPGFCELSQDDQLILIKVGFFEMWLTHVSRLASDSALTFADGAYITRQQMELMYDPEFVASLFHFCRSLSMLALGDTETALFSATVLLCADRPGLTDSKTIERHHDHLVETLKLQVSRLGAEPGLANALLLGKLPELRGLGVKHLEQLDWFRLHWAQLRLPPLFAEIFDIPKCEEDLQ